MAKPKAPKRPRTVDAYVPMVVSQPSLRSSTIWTPGHLQALSLQADGGDLYRLGDLCDQLMADDRINELLGTLADEVLGCDLSFEKTPKSKVGDAEKASELEVDWPLGYDDDELASLLKWTQITGVGFAKHESWIDSPEGGRIIPRTKWWHPKHFAWGQKDRGEMWERTWKVRGHDGMFTEIAAGDGTWIIATLLGEYRPWAQGLWRGLAPWWLLKHYARLDAGVASEQGAKTVVVATDNEATDENRRALADYIYNAGKDPVIALPPGFDMKLLERRASTKDIYLSQIEMANEAFSIAILGQNLTTKVEGGSYAATKEHSEKENRKARSAGRTCLSKPLQAQSLVWWSEFNFGSRKFAAYPFWHTEPAENYSDKALLLKVVGDGVNALKTAGFKVTAEFINEEYGLDVTEAPPPEPPPVVVQGAPGLPGKQPVPPKAPGKVIPIKKAATALASGDDPDTARGFIAGQVYNDALTDKATALAADDASAFVDRIIAAVTAGGDDYEQIRANVLKAYADEEDPERLVELVENSILLARLNGRFAVQVDADADES